MKKQTNQHSRQLFPRRRSKPMVAASLFTNANFDATSNMSERNVVMQKYQMMLVQHALPLLCSLRVVTLAPLVASHPPSLLPLMRAPLSLVVASHPPIPASSSSSLPFTETQTSGMRKSQGVRSEFLRSTLQTVGQATFHNFETIQELYFQTQTWKTDSDGGSEAIGHVKNRSQRKQETKQRFLLKRKKNLDP